VVVGLAIMPSRYSYGLIEESGEFGVNFTTADMVEVVERCGSVSGREVGDKVAHVGLTPFAASRISAPLIAECPVNLECKLLDIIPAGDHGLFRGEVLVEHVARDCLDADGNILVERLNPLCYIRGEYWSADKRLGRHRFTRG